MKLIRGLINLKTFSTSGCVATIGNFDGIHLGHQAILQQVVAKAKSLSLPATLIIFEPQPQEFFMGDAAPARLMRLREKWHALSGLGIDQVLCLSFNKSFSQLTAQEFIQQVLVDGLAVKHLVVGDDFQFGHGRSGNFNTLKLAGEQSGFDVEATQTCNFEGERVSSTRIRKALSAGDMEKAALLLGRPFGLCGRVAHGAKRGRTIGFPTANLFLHRKNAPVEGVYAVDMVGLGAEPVHGVANVGSRPTVDGTRILLEVHLFDFNQSIYGEQVQVIFRYKIRNEKKFESFDKLKEQIERDAQQARDYFNEG